MWSFSTFSCKYSPFGGSSSGPGGETRGFYLRRVRRRVPRQEVRHFRAVERVRVLIPHRQGDALTMPLEVRGPLETTPGHF